jgi:hypothetical protein
VADLAAAPADPILAGELPDADVVAIRESMIGRHRDVESVVEKIAVQQIVRDGHPVVDPVLHHGEIELATSQRGHRLVGFPLSQCDEQIWVLRAQLDQHRRQQPPSGGGERGNRHRPGHGAPMPGEFGLDPLDVSQQHARVIAEQGAGRGEPDAASGSFHQRLANLSLEPGQLLRDGGCRDVQRACRADDRPARHHRMEYPQPLEVQHRRDATQWGPRRVSCA